MPKIATIPSPCKETVNVVWPGEAFGYSNKALTLPCCLMSPHPGFRHTNPRLQLTVGGGRIEVDAAGEDITQTWGF